jgi:hypothetical protein
MEYKGIKHIKAISRTMVVRDRGWGKWGDTS